MEKDMKKILFTFAFLIVLAGPTQAIQTKIVQTQPLYQKPVPHIVRTRPAVHTVRYLNTPQYYYSVDSFGKVNYYDSDSYAILPCGSISHCYPHCSTYGRGKQVYSLPSGGTLGINVTYTLNRSGTTVRVIH